MLFRIQQYIVATDTHTFYMLFHYFVCFAIKLSLNVCKIHMPKKNKYDVIVHVASIASCVFIIAVAILYLIRLLLPLFFWFSLARIFNMFNLLVRISGTIITYGFCLGFVLCSRSRILLFMNMTPSNRIIITFVCL